MPELLDRLKDVLAAALSATNTHEHLIACGVAVGALLAIAGARFALLAALTFLLTPQVGHLVGPDVGNAVTTLHTTSAVLGAFGMVEVVTKLMFGKEDGQKAFMVLIGGLCFFCWNLLRPLQRLIFVAAAALLGALYGSHLIDADLWQRIRDVLQQIV